VNVNLRGLLATQRSNTTPFDVHSDMAPAFYLIGNPAADDPVTRTFEHDVGGLEADNPFTGAHENLTDKMIDPVGMRLLHMVTGDPLRTPSLVAFLQPDYFGFAGVSNCTSPCVTVQPGFAWNHGGIAPEVATTWAGIVGPGVRTLGRTDATWTDHTDLRPTMLALLGLQDDYALDGRAITEIMKPKALPLGLRSRPGLARSLGAVYKQINAPFGAVGLAGIDVSTMALEGDDATYAQLEGELSDLTADRDAIASQMRDVLNAATFAGHQLTEREARVLIHVGNELIRRAQALAAQAAAPS